MGIENRMMPLTSPDDLQKVESALEQNTPEALQQALLAEIDAAIAQSSDLYFQEGAQFLKVVVVKGVADAAVKGKDLDFVKNFLEYVKLFQLDSLKRVLRSEMDGIASRKDRFEIWKGENGFTGIAGSTVGVEDIKQSQGQKPAGSGPEDLQARAVDASFEDMK